MDNKNFPLFRQDEREFYISRICAGHSRLRFKDLTLCVFPASPEIEYEGSEIYRDVYSDAYDSGILTVEESYEILRRRGLWTEKNEKDLETAPDNIDKLKVELYKAAFKSNTRRKIRQRLSITKEEYIRLLGKKNVFSSYTCSGLANYAKWNFIIEHTTFFKGKKFDWSFLSTPAVMLKFNSQILTPEQIRYLSRTDPWITTWPIKKKNGYIFSEPLTNEQKFLMNWSMMYDSVNEAYESPSKEIIEDDDMLDGWLIIQRKNREKEQAKKHGEESFEQNEKIAQSAEIYIPTESNDDIERVHNMNDPRANAIRQARLAQIEQQGNVKHGAFRDVVQQVRMDAHNAYMDKVRKK